MLAKYREYCRLRLGNLYRQFSTCVQRTGTLLIMRFQKRHESHRKVNKIEIIHNVAVRLFLRLLVFRLIQRTHIDCS